MDGFAGIFVVLLSFAVTFTVARLLSRDFRKRRAEQEALKGQSRQVRRARERRRSK